MVSCCSVAEVTDSLQPHGLQRTRFPCPSLMVSRVLESLMGPRHMVPCHQDLLNIPSFLIQTGSRGKKKRKKANSRATNAVFHKCSVINCSFSSAKDRFFFPLLLSSFTGEPPMGGWLSHLALAACAHKFAYAKPVYGSLMEHGARAFCKHRVDNHGN